MQEKLGILYIKLSDEITYNFNNSLKENIHSLFPKIPYLEIDNFSDNLMIHYAQKFTQQFSVNFIIIQSENTTKKISSLNNLLYKLQKNESFFFIDNSHNTLLMRMLNKEKKYFNDLKPNKIIELISHYI